MSKLVINACHVVKVDAYCTLWHKIAVHSFLCLRQRSGRRHYVFGSSVRPYVRPSVLPSVRPSVCPSVRPSVRPVLFLLISQEPWSGSTSNLVWGYILGGGYFLGILGSRGQRSKVTGYFCQIYLFSTISQEPLGRFSSYLAQRWSTMSRWID